MANDGWLGRQELYMDFQLHGAKWGRDPVVIQGSTTVWHLGSELRLPRLKKPVCNFRCGLEHMTASLGSSFTEGVVTHCIELVRVL